MTLDNTHGRDTNGRWIKGFGGRPKGVKNHCASLAQIKGLEQTALQKLFENILKGDSKSIFYVLDRCLPKDRTLEFHDLDISNLKEALTTGQLSIQEGKELSVTLKNVEELESLNDVRERLADLELAAKGE
jgi:hypothetical protein